MIDFSQSKKKYLTFNWNLPWYDLYTLPHVLSMRLLLKRESLSFLLPSFKYWNIAMRSPPSHLFSWMNKHSSFSLICQALQAFNHLSGFSLDPLQAVHIFFELWRPKLNTVFLVWPEKHQVEWNNHFFNYTLQVIPLLTQMRLLFGFWFSSLGFLQKEKINPPGIELNWAVSNMFHTQMFSRSLWILLCLESWMWLCVCLGTDDAKIRIVYRCRNRSDSCFLTLL